MRQLKTALPDCEIVLVFNYLRTYMPVARRTGTQAWADGHLTEAEYASLYHQAAPQLLSAVAAKYDLPTISTIPFFDAVGRGGHDALFRDDCHHTEAGGRLAASLVAEGLLACFRGPGVGNLPAAPTLPAPIDPQNWSAGKATLVDESMVAFGGAGGGARGGKRRADRDPITGDSLDWWTLDPGDTVTVVFDGSGFGIITHIGPDSGTLRYCIEGLGRKGKDAPATVRREGTKALFDEWGYYYRLSAVLLATDLPLGTYRVTISLAAAVPDRSVARRPVPPDLSRRLKLWVSHAVVVGTWCGAHRALPAPPATQVSAVPQTAAPAWVAPLRSE